MKKYEITVRVGRETHKKIVEAKNINEANDMALSMGHKLSNFGQGHFFSGVSVKSVNTKRK